MGALVLHTETCCSRAPKRHIKRKEPTTRDLKFPHMLRPGGRIRVPCASVVSSPSM